MATSGSINFSPASALNQSIYPQYAKFSWSASWDSTNNRWNIEWNVTAQGGQDSYKWVTTHATSSVTIAAVTGTAAGAGTKTLNATIAQTHNDDIILQGSFTLTPTSAGAAKFSVAGNIYFVNISDSYKSSHSASSDQQTLDTAALGSTITLSTTSKTIGSTSDANLVVTVKSNGNYYHELSYKSDNSTSAVSVLAEQIDTTTKTVNITPTNILAKFPSAAGGTLTFTLKTYTSSAKTTQVGTTKTATCSITITTANFKPIASPAAIAVATWSTRGSGTIEDTLVAGYSTASLSVTTTAGSGTSVSKINYTIQQGDTVISSGTINSYSGSITTSTLPSSTSTYTLKINVTAVDARGQAGTPSMVTRKVYGYAPPVITASIYRTSTNSSTNHDEAGEFVYVTYSATASSVNSKNSVQTSSCAYSGGISGSASSGDHLACSIDKTAKFVVTVTDKVETVTKTVYIDPGLFALELYDNKSGTLYAKSGGYFKSTRSGGLGFIQEGSSGSLGVRISRTDTTNDIQLIIGSNGISRGLYSAQLNGWITYYDNTDYVFNTNTKALNLVKGPSAGNSYSKIQLVPHLAYSDLGLSSSGWNLAFFEAWMKKILELYPSYTDTIFIGRITPGSKGFAVWYVYDMTQKSSGLPQYSFGQAYCYKTTSGTILENPSFGTASYTAYYNDSSAISLPLSNATGTLGVGNGGTGVNSAAGSKKQPVYLAPTGLTTCSALTSLLGSSFSTGSKTLTSGSANYNYLIVMGTPSTGSAKSSVVIPTAMLSGTDQLFGFSNETYGVSFYLKTSGTNGKDVTITFNVSSSGSGAITNVYGGI